MFLPAQRDDISVDFLNYLETELDGQLCTQTLLELYQIYKRYVIQYKSWISSHPAQSWNFRRLWR